jgi:TENA/THI-4/PQQC family
MSMLFHEMLREANRVAWDAMQIHPFVRAVEEGRLASDAFLRYLAYERDFVGAAIEIFALALIKAPGFSAQHHLIGVLRALAADRYPTSMPRLPPWAPLPNRARVSHPLWLRSRTACLRSRDPAPTPRS